MNGKIKCNKCNNMIPIGAPYCIFCGAEQVPQNAPQTPKSRRRKQANNMPIVRAGEDVMVPVNVEEPVTEQKLQEKTVQEQIKAEKKSAEKEAAITQRTETQVENEQFQSSQENGIEKPEEKVSDAPEEEKSIIAEKKESIYSEPVEAPEKPKDEESDGNENSAQAVHSPEKPSKTDKPSKPGKGWKEKKEKKEEEYEQNHDDLTGIMNKKAFDEKIAKINPANLGNVCIIIGDINNLAKTNEMHGRGNGDILITSVAQSLRAVFGNNCYRIGEDEFAVVLEKISEKTVSGRIESLRQELRQREREQRGAGRQIDMKVAVGYSYGDEAGTIQEVIDAAQRRMQTEKNQMKQIYDPNYDGYYNDVKTEYEELKVQIDRDNVHKVVLLLLAFAAFMVFYFIFMV